MFVYFLAYINSSEGNIFLSLLFFRRQLLSFLLTLLPHMCKISKSFLVPVPSYWTWTKTTLKKIVFFWSYPYKTEVVVASLIEKLE